MTHIGYGCYGITAVQARELAGGVLPGPGREKLVETKAGVAMWLSRWHRNGVVQWTLRDGGGWKLVDGVAVLGG